MIRPRSPSVLPVVRTREGLDADAVSDEALLAGLAVGDEASGIALVRRYERRVFGLARTMVGDPGLAEDIAQEAFVRVWRHAAIFDAWRGSVANWILTITRNLAIDALRVRRAVPIAEDDPAWVDLVSTERTPEDATVLSDAAGRVRLALRSLPAEQRRAVVLAGLYGRTAAEIASSEAVPLGTAKSRIRLGLSRVREALLVEEVP